MWDGRPNTTRKLLEMSEFDLIVESHGTIALLGAGTDRGREWIDKLMPENAQRVNGAVVIEHRMVSDIVQGARAGGFNVKMELAFTTA